MKRPSGKGYGKCQWRCGVDQPRTCGMTRRTKKWLEVAHLNRETSTAFHYTLRRNLKCYKFQIEHKCQ